MDPMSFTITENGETGRENGGECIMCPTKVKFTIIFLVFNFSLYLVNYGMYAYDSYNSYLMNSLMPTNPGYNKK